MNVLFIADKLNISRGGESRSLHVMSNQLSNLGHEVTVGTLNIAIDNRPPDNRNYKIQELVSDCNDRISSVVKEVFSYLLDNENRFDIYHCFSPQFNFILGAYSKYSGETPTIGRLNNYTFCTNKARMTNSCYKNCTLRKKHKHSDNGGNLNQIPKYSFKTYLEPRLLNNLDNIFAISPTVKTIYSHNGVNNEIMRLVPNFIDPEFDYYSKERDVDQPLYSSDNRNVVYVGRMAKEKGVEILLDASKALSDEYTLHLVGKGPMDDRIRESPRENIKFHGWVENCDLPIYYSSADLFIHPATWPEPFGRTILESMQCGTPVLTSDIGAPPWVAGSAGKTFETGSPDELAKEIINIFESDGALDDLVGNLNKELERFKTDRILSMIENTYMELYSG